MARWTEEQVLELAPDDASVRAARALLGAGSWPSAGCSARALWGEARGSGRRPYQAVVDPSGPAYRCSCPSRKFPCKHALALALRWAAGDIADGAEPAWAAEWLDGRAGSAGAAPAAAAAPARVPDPEAAAARAARRTARIGDGVEDLDRWLRDLARGGLAAAQARPFAFWDGAAARLVDAQAPGLASRVRRLGGLAHSGDGWPERVLAEAGRLRLAVAAWQHGAGASDALQADVRAAVGWALPTDAVLAEGERVADRWVVVGRVQREEERLTVRRTWLRGERGSRPALLLQFAPPGGSFEGDHVPGTAWDGELAFFPGGAPLRALVADGPWAVRPAPGLPADPGISAALRGWAAGVGANPWLDRWPLGVAGVVTVRGARGAWSLRDEDDGALPLAGTDHADLVAFAGGRAVTVAGEWDGERLRPLTAADADRVVAL